MTLLRPSSFPHNIGVFRRVREVESRSRLTPPPPLPLLTQNFIFIGSFAYITKTRLCNFDPFKPHFYIVKLGCTEVTLFFLFLLKNIDCGYSLESPSTHNLCFKQKYEKISDFLSENFNFFGGKKFNIFE